MKKIYWALSLWGFGPVHPPQFGHKKKGGGGKLGINLGNLIVLEPRGWKGGFLLIFNLQKNKKLLVFPFLFF